MALNKAFKKSLTIHLQPRATNQQYRVISKWLSEPNTGCPALAPGTVTSSNRASEVYNITIFVPLLTHMLRHRCVVTNVKGGHANKITSSSRTQPINVYPGILSFMLGDLRYHWLYVLMFTAMVGLF